MFVLGHLGIGGALIKKVRPDLPLAWALLGTVLPDLIDKPVYLVWSQLHGGVRGQALGLISGTRTFGHTALFLLALTLLTLAVRSRRGLALCLGVGTHLIIDGLYTRYGQDPSLRGPASALLWPWTWNARFPFDPHSSTAAHAATLAQTQLWVAEAVGGYLLWKITGGKLRGRIAAYQTKRPR